MPYNNTPIEPPRELTGTVSLPLARVKKIINLDPDIGACSNNAAFAIAVATERFVQYIVEQSYKSVKAEKAEKKPRKNLGYRDVANAVARVDNLEFLADVVPRTMTYKAYKDKKAAKEREAGVEQQHVLTNGQRTLDQMSKHHQYEREDTEMTEDADEEMYNGNGTANGHAYDEDGPSSPEVKQMGRHRYDAVRDEIQEDTPEDD